MTEADFDVVGIGNALVDVISTVDDDFIEAHDFPHGATTMVELDRAEAVYADLPPAQEISGGSCANTIAGLASFGASVAFIGRVRDDQLGKVYTHDLRSLGVHFDVPPATAGPATGRCLVMVTPDAQRTQCTYLGASTFIGPEDVDPAVVARAQVTYLEGYLWDQPPAKNAIRKAAAAARDAGRRVALTLSDPFCVDRHRSEFRALVEDEIDVLFANETEICSLYEVDDFDAALQRVRGHCQIAALTRSERGSVVVAGDEVHVIDAHPIDRVVDTTGAGDQYAAGFLYGLTRGLDLATCGRLGAAAAAEVISHFGARPLVSLAELAETVVR
ncbi:MAG TPA: adenosine kinase [Acidimicrobiia bacterium]|nr:adenosine kinase [Acidimicrobiia bacterium]